MSTEKIIGPDASEAEYISGEGSRFSLMGLHRVLFGRRTSRVAEVELIPEPPKAQAPPEIGSNSPASTRTVDGGYVLFLDSTEADQFPPPPEAA